MLWSGFQGKKNHTTHAERMATTGDYLQLPHWASSANPNSFPKRGTLVQSSINKYFWMVSVWLKQAMEVLQLSTVSAVCKASKSTLLAYLMDTINPGLAEGTRGWVWMRCVPLFLMHSGGEVDLESASFPHRTWNPPSIWNAPFTCLRKKLKTNTVRRHTVPNMNVRCQPGKEWRARRKHHLIPKGAAEITIYFLLPMWSCGDCEQFFSLFWDLPTGHKLQGRFWDPHEN